MYMTVKQAAEKWEDRGVYRRVPVRIMGAKHEAVQPYLIRPKVEQLLEDYFRKVYPLLKIEVQCIFSHMITDLHTPDNVSNRKLP